MKLKAYNKIKDTWVTLEFVSIQQAKFFNNTLINFIELK
jgi:hypothetical protein